MGQITVRGRDSKKPPKIFLLDLARALETGKGKGRRESVGEETVPSLLVTGFPAPTPGIVTEEVLLCSSVKRAE